MMRQFISCSLLAAATVFAACGSSPAGNNQGVDGGSGGQGAAVDSGALPTDTAADHAGNGSGGSTAPAGAGGGSGTGGAGGNGGASSDGSARDTEPGGTGGASVGNSDGGACPATPPSAKFQDGGLVFLTCPAANQGCGYDSLVCECKPGNTVGSSSALVWVCLPVI